jgi:hypothetical protein
VTSDQPDGASDKPQAGAPRLKIVSDALDKPGGIHNLLDALLEELENVEDGATRVQALRDIHAALERACRMWAARLVEGLDCTDTPENRSATLALAFEYLTAAAGA